eukprot:5711401-Pyramimonas_sp.AAC.1
MRGVGGCARGARPLLGPAKRVRCVAGHLGECAQACISSVEAAVHVSSGIGRGHNGDMRGSTGCVDGERAWRVRMRKINLVQARAARKRQLARWAVGVGR